MAQPDVIPEFASDQSSDPTNYKTVEPLTPKKKLGARNSERFPAGYLNWLFYWIYRWVIYVRDIAGEEFTWTAEHEFEEAVTMRNGLLVSAGAVVFDDDVTCGAGLTAFNLATGEPDVRYSARVTTISMADFQIAGGVPDGNTASHVFYDVGLDEIESYSGASAETPFARYPLNLPAGTNIRSLSLTAKTSNAGDPSDLWLVRKSMTTGLFEYLGTRASVVSTSIATDPSSTFNHEIEDGYTYSLVIQKELATHNGVFYGASFTHDYQGA